MATWTYVCVSAKVNNEESFCRPLLPSFPPSDAAAAASFVSSPARARPPPPQLAPLSEFPMSVFAPLSLTDAAACVVLFVSDSSSSAPVRPPSSFQSITVIAAFLLSFLRFSLLP